MSEIDSVEEELRQGALILRENVTLIEQRAQAMMLDSLAGESNEHIALRYGVSPDIVNDMIRTAINDCLAAKRHREIQSVLLKRLLIADSELADLFNSLPDFGEREFQKLTSAGEIKSLKEDVCNVPAKVKIIAERRHHVMATLALLGANTGEIPAEQKDREIAEILATIYSAVKAVMREHAKRALPQARETACLKSEIDLEMERDQIEPVAEKV